MYEMSTRFERDLGKYHTPLKWHPMHVALCVGVLTIVTLNLNWGPMLCSSFNDVLNPLVTFFLHVHGLVVAIVVGMDGFKKTTIIYKRKKPEIVGKSLS